MSTEASPDVEAVDIPASDDGVAGHQASVNRSTSWGWTRCPFPRQDRGRCWSTSGRPASTSPTRCWPGASTRSSRSCPSRPDWSCAARSSPSVTACRRRGSASGSWAPRRCRTARSPSSRSPTRCDVVPAPTGLDDAGASVFHIAYQTGWFGLYRRANLRVGETLLVHAAAGGVGSAAIQLGRAQGAHVIGVVGSADKVPVARKLGAETVIDRSEEDVVEAVKAATKGRGVDVVFDPVGGPAFELSTKVIAFEGRIVVVGFAGGEIAAGRHQPRAGQELRRCSACTGASTAGRSRTWCAARTRSCRTSWTPAPSRRCSPSGCRSRTPPAGIARIAAGETTGRLAVNMP